MQYICPFVRRSTLPWTRSRYRATLPVRYSLHEGNLARYAFSRSFRLPLKYAGLRMKFPVKVCYSGYLLLGPDKWSRNNCTTLQPLLGTRFQPRASVCTSYFESSDCFARLDSMYGTREYRPPHHKMVIASIQGLISTRLALCRLNISWDIIIWTYWKLKINNACHM